MQVETAGFRMSHDGRLFGIALHVTGGLVLTSLLSGAVALAAAGVVRQDPPAPSEAAPRFRSSVDLVSVVAVVRDRKGRFVTDLSRRDFEILEAGKRRPILDFRAELDGPVRIALLIDISGSMRIGPKPVDARQAAEEIFSSMTGDDQAAVYTFDTGLSEAQPFTSVRAKLEAALDNVEEPYGQTSLYDAIARTARSVAEASTSASHGVPQRSAVVVITDGVDTRSQLTPQQVSVAASGIDVPVYIIAVMAGIDDPRVSGNRRQADTASDLRELARDTGGELFVASAPDDLSNATRQMVGEMRHQYVLAFEASPKAGFRPLEVRTRQSSLVVRARTGYNGSKRTSHGGGSISNEESLGR